jgi:hypothetical protein
LWTAIKYSFLWHFWIFDSTPRWIWKNPLNSVIKICRKLWSTTLSAGLHQCELYLSSSQRKEKFISSCYFRITRGLYWIKHLISHNGKIYCSKMLHICTQVVAGNTPPPKCTDHCFDLVI